MKKLFIFLLCLGWLGVLEAQNIWTDLLNPYGLIGVAANDDRFYSGAYYDETLYRSRDFGETMEPIYDQSNVETSEFLINKQGRIFVFNDHTNKIWYSDDNGDTWNVQPNGIARNYVDRMYSVSNDSLFLCSNNILAWTLDGGETWNETTLPFLDDDQTCIGLLADRAGNVYVGNTTGIYSATTYDMTQWELKAESEYMRQMELDNEGNIIVAETNYHNFIYHNGVYFTGRYTIAVSDDDVVFTIQRLGQAHNILLYSTDHGEHFIPVGEYIYSWASGPQREELYMCNDQRLYTMGWYYFQSYEWIPLYYRSTLRADEIVNQSRQFAPQGAEWYFHVLSNGPITEPPFYYVRYSVTGVEEVHGHTCSVVNDDQYVYQENNIVYWYNQTKDEFTVLYDFNAEAGDSWYCDVAECTYLVTVDSVGYIVGDSYFDISYRRQHVTAYESDGGTDPIFEGWIIDGIGYDKGLFPDELTCYGGGNDSGEFCYIRCYYEEGNTTMLYHYGEYSCTFIPDAVSENTESPIKVYPTPAKDRVVIEGIDPAEVQVYNGLGQVVKTVRDANEISVAGLAEGVYLLRITDTEGKKHVARVAVKR